MEKRKALHFSGSFVACDLKVGQHRLVELMKFCEYSRSRSFPVFGQRLNEDLIFSETI